MLYAQYLYDYYNVDINLIKKRSTSEEAALTVNPSNGVHTQLKRNNNDNPTNEESHHREPVQHELQEDIVETRNLSEVENLEYYSTISEY